MHINTVLGRRSIVSIVYLSSSRRLFKTSKSHLRVSGSLRVSRMASQGNTVWSFGYGSNMDVEALQGKKHVKVVEHTCAVLKGYKMNFNLRGLAKVEPSYANVVKGDPTDEVHGVAFCMTKESGQELDRTESGYVKLSVTLNAYDGREIESFVYVNKPEATVDEDIPPSRRYLGVLIKGARQAGLSEDYIKRLSQHEVYEPSDETLTRRAALPKPSDLPKVTVSQLAEHGPEAEDRWVSVLGHVISKEPGKWTFNSHLGRDITTRALNQYHGIPLDDNDDLGRPPYPLVSDLDPAALEYVATWRDHHLGNSNKVVGYLQEFREQQESGKSDWTLPSKE